MNDSDKKAHPERYPPGTIFLFPKQIADLKECFPEITYYVRRYNPWFQGVR